MKTSPLTWKGLRLLGHLPTIRRLVLSLLLVASAAAIRSARAEEQYAVIDLGSLGGTDTRAWAVNDTGQVVGRATLTGGEQRAFLWDASSGMADVNLPVGGLLTARSARGINDAGQVVGGGTMAGNGRAFLWESGSGITDLGTLGGTSSTALGINSGGQVVGRSTTPAGEVRPFLWESGSGMTSLGTLGGDDVNNAAHDVNDVGQVVGGVATGTGSIHAFLWVAGAGMTDLGTLGGDDSVGWAINSGGQVVGWSKNILTVWRRAAGAAGAGRRRPREEAWPARGPGRRRSS